MDEEDVKVQNNNAEKVWNETCKQYYVEFDYDGSTYQMWMEEENSIEEKMKLIKQYDLAGVSSWRRDMSVPPSGSHPEIRKLNE